MPLYENGIIITSGFEINSNKPIDYRSVVQDLTERDAIPSGQRYEGLKVYVVDEQTAYRLIGGILDANWTEIGTGGGGGGAGANWQPALGLGPIESYEFSEKVWLFTKDANQQVELWLKVPTSYSPGDPINLKVGFYSTASSNVWAFALTYYLVRKETDAIDSSANGAVIATSDMTNTVAKMLREIVIPITTDGEINAVAINPGDLIRLTLTRQAPSAGTEDTTDIRFIPSFTEVLFA